MMNQNQKIILPLAYLFIGLFYFFHPFLASWFQIVDPFVAKNLFLPIDWIIFSAEFSLQWLFGDYIEWFPDIVFGIISLVYLLLFFMKVVRSDWSKKLKRFTFLPLVVFPIIWLSMSPLGLSFWGEKRVNSYVVGGWSRMILAGGSTALKNDCTYLLENTTNPEPAWQDLPASIRRLDGWVDVEFDKQLVLIGLGRMYNMANEFGFIIYQEDESLPIPRYLEGSERYRIWRLDDGVYFFDR